MYTELNKALMLLIHNYLWLDWWIALVGSLPVIDGSDNADVEASQSVH